MVADYFYEMLAYVYDGRFYGRMNMPIRKQYSKVPSLLRRLGIKNADKIFKQLTKDEEFVKFAKSKLNNSECRLLGLGEKRVRKSKPVTKVKQTTLGDFLMKIRAGKRAINKLIKIVADDELTTKQIYDRMLQQSSQRSDLTFRQLTNILGSYFEEVGYDNKTKVV